MAETTIKVGIVGAKFAASFHHASYQRAGDLPVKVTGVHSATKKSRSAFAKERGIEAFDEFKALLKAVDVVDICVPGYKHEEFAVAAAQAGKHVIVEKPFTGFFQPKNAPKDWRGDEFDKKTMLREAMESARRILQATSENGVKLMYAENWVYAPAIQKEVEILRASGGQILWMQGEESHSGSHSPAYGDWKLAGGGSLVGKGCHPLTAMLYLKREEGISRGGGPIRPRYVNARVHNLTRNPNFDDRGFLRADYHDVEDFAQLHIVFEDGMVADLVSNEIVMGGVHNWLEIYANNHRYRANINPNDCGILYNPDEKQLDDVYISEKIGTKQGWSFPSPDEDWMTGYPQEIRDFMECVHQDREPKSGAELAADTTSVMYAAYLSDERKGAEVEIPLISF